MIQFFLFLLGSIVTVLFGLYAHRRFRSFWAASSLAGLLGILPFYSFVLVVTLGMDMGPQFWVNFWLTIPGVYVFQFVLASLVGLVLRRLAPRANGPQRTTSDASAA